MARKRTLFQHSIYAFLRTQVRRWLLLFCLSVILTLTITPVFSQSVINPEQLVRQAEQAYQAGNLIEAAEYLQEAVNLFQIEGESQIKNLAISSTNLCKVQLQLGQTENALKNCQVATQIYTQLQDNAGKVRSQVYQAYALQKLGFYPRACTLLSDVVALQAKSCNELNEELLEAVKIEVNLDSVMLTAWRILGDNLKELGKLNESKIILEKIVQFPNNPDIAATQLSLGNTLAALGILERDRQAIARYNYQPWMCEITYLSELAKEYYELAFNQYEEAAKTKSRIIQIKADLNRLKLLLELSEFEQAQKLASEIDLSGLPKNQFKIYSQINYSKSLACLQQKENIKKTLENSLQEAKELGDKKAESYALGNLGGLAEYLKDYTEARAKTEQALYLAQGIPSLEYQWQWQLGRILEVNGNQKEAISLYRIAIKNLELVRQDLLQINSDVQFSFRDNVEPLYRQLINLLLTEQNYLEASQYLNESIYYIESLQLAELSNFLRCNPEDFSQNEILTNNSSENAVSILSEKFEKVHQLSPKTALIYPIVLSDRVVTILSLPEQNLQYYTINVSANQVNALVSKLRNNLNTPRQEAEVRKLSQTIYQWIIAPLKNELQKNQIHTLAFILDSSLQNIPMTALYDGEKYLIEDYAIALVPSLQLLNLSPASSRNISALIAGASNAPSFQKENLINLPKVQDELYGVSERVNEKKVLFEQDFNEDNVRGQINSIPFSIVHIATHGKFSSNPEQTYILDWNQRINVGDLEYLLRLNQQQPIELLILSACETATGDRRATLGLAGVAIRSGARSTLATLWQVNDESTAQLMIKFYENLQNPEYTKVEALRQVQLTFLKQQNSENDYDRAYYWSPFVIVGNWL